MVQRTGMPCAVMFIELCGAAELFEVLGNARAQVAVASQLHMLADTVCPSSGALRQVEVFVKGGSGSVSV